VGFFDGPLAWPFPGFETAGDQIESAPLGEWTEARANDGSWFLIKVRTREVRPPLPAGAAAETLVARIGNLQRGLNQARHRASVLEKIGMAFDWQVGLELVRRIERAPSPENTITPRLIAGCDERLLAKYVAGDAARTVSVASFAKAFNDQLIRRLPASGFELYMMVGDYLTEEVDFEAACALGFRDRAKFREDRENFRNYQALDLFEQERIRPMLEITEAEIAAYYHQRVAEFSVADQVVGQLFVFGDIRAAVDFLRQSREAPFPPDQLPAGAGRSEPLVIASATGLPGWSGPMGELFALRNERSAGPYFKGKEIAVWVRREIRRERRLPLSEVAAQIRTRMETERLPAFEAKLAREWSGDLAIADHIDYGGYGAGPELTKPWD
jgi:hypothetical protein